MTEPTRHTWEGQSVRWAEYDAEDYRLTIAFVSGSVYDFEGVARKFFTDMKGVADPGRFVRTHLMGRFEFSRRRLRDRSAP